jgi:hypothetical protein
LTRRRVFGHFLNSDALRVLVKAVSVFAGECIAISISGRHGVVTFRSFTEGVLSVVSQVGVVAVVLDHTLLGGFTVVHGGLNLRFNQVHLGYNTTHRDELIYESSVQATGSNMILTKVTLERDVILLNFSRESSVSLVGHLLFVALAFSALILHVLDSSIKLTFKHIDGLNRVLLDKVSKVFVSSSNLIDCERKPVLVLSNQLLNALGSFAVCHELVNLFLHAFLEDGRGFVAGVSVLSSINLHS